MLFPDTSNLNLEKTFQFSLHMVDIKIKSVSIILRCTPWGYPDMHSITPYHSITSDRTDLDMGGINYSTLQSTHLKTFRQESADFTIVTAEGDKVMFSSSSQFQATYVTYDSFARTKGEFALFQGESFDLNTNRELIISVGR